MTCVQSKLAKVFLHMLINQHIADREKQMYKGNMADLLSSEITMTSHSWPSSLFLSSQNSAQWK